MDRKYSLPTQKWIATMTWGHGQEYSLPIQKRMAIMTWGHGQEYSLPIQKRMATMTWGHGQESPQMVVVRYHKKNGSQQTRKAPITTPRVTNALCSLRQLADRTVRLSWRPEKYLENQSNILIQVVWINYLFLPSLEAALFLCIILE